jgi:hypothetical protein
MCPTRRHRRSIYSGHSRGIQSQEEGGNRELPGNEVVQVRQRKLRQLRRLALSVDLPGSPVRALPCRSHLAHRHAHHAPPALRNGHHSPPRGALKPALPDRPRLGRTHRRRHGRRGTRRHRGSRLHETFSSSSHHQTLNSNPTQCDAQSQSNGAKVTQLRTESHVPHSSNLEPCHQHAKFSRKLRMNENSHRTATYKQRNIISGRRRGN